MLADPWQPNEEWTLIHREAEVFWKKYENEGSNISALRYSSHLTFLEEKLASKQSNEKEKEKEKEKEREREREQHFPWPSSQGRRI